jgi:hypothetical protein
MQSPSFKMQFIVYVPNTENGAITNQDNVETPRWLVGLKRFGSPSWRRATVVVGVGNRWGIMWDCTTCLSDPSVPMNQLRVGPGLKSQRQTQEEGKGDLSKQPDLGSGSQVSFGEESEGAIRSGQFGWPWSVTKRNRASCSFHPGSFWNGLVFF